LEVPTSSKRIQYQQGLQASSSNEQLDDLFPEDSNWVPVPFSSTSGSPPTNTPITSTVRSEAVVLAPEQPTKDVAIPPAVTSESSSTSTENSSNSNSSSSGSRSGKTKKKKIRELGTNSVRTFQGGEMVKLNVGGQLFLTTVDTLVKTKSMLSTMFSGKIPVMVDRDGYVFIDRDGKFFGKILNFLRNGSIEPPRDRAKCYDMYKEAEFYQLRAMMDQLAEQLESDCVVANSLKYIANKVGKQVTVIKNETEKEILVREVMDPIVILEVSSSSFGEEKDAIIYKHLVLFDKLSSDYGDKILFVKQIVYTGKEWKFYNKGKLQHSVFFYNQYNGKHSFQEEIILDRILKLVLI